MKKNKKSKRVCEESDQSATRDNTSLLLRKFKCRPCFVKLIRPEMAPKKKTAKKSNIGSCSERITRRRATTESRVSDQPLNTEPPAKQISRRRASTTGKSVEKTCRGPTRSKQIVAGNYSFVHSRISRSLLIVYTCDILKTNFQLKLRLIENLKEGGMSL